MPSSSIPMKKYIPLYLLTFFLAVACHETKKNGAQQPVAAIDPNVPAAYTKYCASCHGPSAETLVKRSWKHGNSRLEIMKAIRDGYPAEGMNGYAAVLKEDQILDLAKYIIETQEKLRQRASVDNTFKENHFVSEGMKFHLDTVLTGLQNPWGMVFLPNGDLIFTEKPGSIWRLDSQRHKTEITGGPKVLDEGQGGLLDVEIHPDFSHNHWIYFTYSKPKSSEGKTLAATAVFRARLEGNQLLDGQDIFVAEPYESTRHHYGSRMEFGKDGYLYVSVGERGHENEYPQFLDKGNGKIHRITDSGGIPPDNPFVNTPGAVKSIWSYGHRNPQGLAFNPYTGELWEHEHGPRGGDELNLIQPGKNYGWPIVSYGTHYDGRSFTDKTEMDGIQSPVTYWVPSIAPCGMAFVTGDRYPPWKGDMLIGSLSFRFLNRVHLNGHSVAGQERLFEGIGRVRMIAMSNDGYIWFSVEGPGGYIFRIVPE